MKVESYWSEFITHTKSILFLQGPIGYYFNELSQYLESAHGCDVYKINFNAADEFFYPKATNSFTYREDTSRFYAYLEKIVQQHNIEAIVCFGHHRVYHNIAKEFCLTHRDRVNFWVFEEGYLRPHYITFEKWGVNFNSTLTKRPEYYLQQPPILEVSNPIPTACGFIPLAKLASKYYLIMALGKKKFPLYKHHREISLPIYFSAWLRAGMRKCLYYAQEKNFARRVTQGKMGDFFIVPLQVHNDSQVTVHGAGKSIPFFIRHIIASFSEHAPPDTKLIIKHHPMDRGFNHYGSLIKNLSAHYDVENRIHYVFDVKLPILLRQAKGMVVLNSTSGLSAMFHELPVKALGHAHYNFEGLTDQQPLKDFWKNPQPPNPELFTAYRLYLLQKTQLNDNFYRNTHPAKWFNSPQKNPLKASN